MRNNKCVMIFYISEDIEFRCKLSFVVYVIMYKIFLSLVIYKC